MAQPNVNPTPQQQFQSYDKNVTKHRALIELPEFDRAIHYALLQMQAMLCDRAADANGAAASHFKMAGAHEFVKILRTLGEQPQARPLTPQAQLDHKA